MVRRFMWKVIWVRRLKKVLTNVHHNGLYRIKISTKENQITETVR